MNAKTIVLNTLAADLAVTPEQLTLGGTSLSLAREVPGRRRFPIRLPYLLIISLGLQEGTVIAASQDLMAGLEKLLPQLEGDLFQGSAIAKLHSLLPENRQLMGPSLKYICLEPISYSIPTHYRLELTETITPEQAKPFPHAVALQRGRPDVLLAVAWHGQEIAGIAGLSADSQDLWQVGIDVLLGHRKQGLAKALVAAVTAEAWQRGKAVYYSTTPGNIASRRLAASSGFVPMWTEVYTC